MSRQIFSLDTFGRQADKYCEDIPRLKSLCCDSEFAHKKEFSVFKFPKRFSEFSWAKRSLYSLFFYYFIDPNHLKN